ncbi:MAG TPA: IPT/TIG domain-containing protein, partial [Acidimicrobiales bacterium]|nr:IPT/TIG domain-containing protein [Acidimicrobiales bacterium]
MASGMQFPFNIMAPSTYTYGSAAIWTSTDAGATWTSQLVGPPASSSSGSFAGGINCFEPNSCVATINPYVIETASSRLYLVPTGGLFEVSSNSGATWTAQSTPPPQNSANSTLVDGIACTSNSQCLASGGVGSGGLVSSPSIAALILEGFIPPPPAVSSLSPSSADSGATITINGTGFGYATGVNFGNVPATSFVVNSSTEITAVVPPGSATVDVTVLDPGGTSSTSPSDVFTYLPPTISQFSNLGNLGTVVTILGSDFTGATEVDFGSVPGTSVTVVSDSEITVVAPSGVPGT